MFDQIGQAIVSVGGSREVLHDSRTAIESGFGDQLVIVVKDRLLRIVPCRASR